MLRGPDQDSGGLFSIYCGLGESYGIPRNKIDALCKEHDDDYDVLIKEGKNPYFTFNWADKKFLKGLQDAVPQSQSESFLKVVARLYAQGKEAFLPHTNAVRVETEKRKRPDETFVSNKHVKTDETESSDKGMEEWTVDGKGVPSLIKSPSTTKMNIGSGTDGTTETPIDKVKNVQRGPPRSQWVNLPYIETYLNKTEQNFVEYTYRMTSVYDCVAAVTSVDLNIGTGDMTTSAYISDGADGLATKARWFDYYAGIYNYYHVSECQWFATVENLDSKPFYVHQYYANDEQPPAGADNDDMMLWSDFRSHYVGAGYAAVKDTGEFEANERRPGTGFVREDTPLVTADNYELADNITRRGSSPIVQLSGSYKTGQHKALIHQDSEIENWTLVNSNPVLREILAFRFKVDQNSAFSNSINSANDQLRFKWHFKCHYLVEFKELKLGLRYPVQRQPLIVTIQNDFSSVN